MTDFDNETIKCSYCGKEFSFREYNSIDVSINPELREKVFTGEIFMHKCPKCGHEEFILNPFIYADSNTGLMVLFNDKSTLIANYVDLDNFSKTKNFTSKMKEIRYIGTSDPRSIPTLVTLDEANIDLRQGYLSTYFYALSVCNDYKKENNKTDVYVKSFILIKDDDEHLQLTVIFNDDNNYTVTIETKNYLDNINDYIKRRISRLKLFVLDIESINIFLADSEHPYKKKETFVIGECLESPEYVICKYDGYLTNFVSEGDSLMVSDEEMGDKFVKLGKIFKCNPNFLPVQRVYDLDHLVIESLKIESNPDDAKFVTNPGVEKLFKKYKRKELNKSTMLKIAHDLKNIDVLIGMKAILNKEIDQYKPGTNLTNELKDVKFAEYVDKRNDRKYLSIYLDILNYNNEFTNPTVLKFEEVVNFVIQGDDYDGIIINPEDDAHIIDKVVLRTYITHREMNEIDIVNTIDSLSPSEIEYIGELPLELIKKAYEPGVNTFTYANVKYGFNKKETGIYLDIGYSRLIEVVRFNYFETYRECEKLTNKA